MRSIMNIKNQPKQLDDVITKELIKTIAGGITCSYIERRFMSLRPKFRRLGILILSKSAQEE